MRLSWEPSSLVVRSRWRRCREKNNHNPGFLSLLWVVLSTIVVLLLPSVTEGSTVDDSTKGPPPFFLQDPTDSLCLAGEDFRRCSIDTLFYVIGKPGSYQIHKRPVKADDDDDDGLCIAKRTCDAADPSTPVKIEQAKLTRCSHCGAKNWNILGDAETGYLLTEGNGNLCILRQESRAMVGPCYETLENNAEKLNYVPLQLQFASASDIAALSSPVAKWIGAATDGDKKLLQSLLKKGKKDDDDDEGISDVNARDWDDLTALMPAASAGHLDVCKFLVKEGIDVNAKDKDGITALMEASIMGHQKIVEFLLDSGAEVDATANSDVTALWLASGEGRTDIMKVLFKLGADATVTRSDGITALMTASAGGHEEAVKLLLENGADPTAADRDGLTPLMNAAEQGNVPIVKLLLAAAEDPVAYMNTVSSTGLGALIVASAHGHVPVIELLLESGADISVVHEENGVTPLMYAAASGHVDAMKTLFDTGKVDVNTLHSNGGTAFMEASTGGFTKAMQFLLDRGAVVNTVDEDGVTPLMAVASLGHYDAEALILDSLKKALSEQEIKDHINLLADSGGSAIMFSAAGGHLNCTKLLYDNGADIHAVSQATPAYLEKVKIQMAEGTYPEPDPHVDRVTALHVAAQSGHLDTVNALLEWGAQLSLLDEEKRTPLYLAVKNNHGDVASALVRAGADPNTVYVDDEGGTRNLLMDALTVENEEFAKLLAEKGADLYYVDDKKVSTLLQASHRGLTDSVKILLEKHAAGGKDGYVDDASDEGITPLIAASSEGHTEIVQALIAAGANVDLKDKDGTNALMAGSARGHVLVAKALLDAGAKVNEQNDDGHTALMFAYNGKNQVETLWERYSQFVADNEKGEEKVDDAGTGPIIKEALANHNALVELLLQKGADTSLKDKEGHTAKDFDFHPDADAEVLKKEAQAEKARDGSKNEL